MLPIVIGVVLVVIVSDASVNLLSFSSRRYYFDNFYGYSYVVGCWFAVGIWAGDVSFDA